MCNPLDPFDPCRFFDPTKDLRREYEMGSMTLYGNLAKPHDEYGSIIGGNGIYNGTRFHWHMHRAAYSDDLILKIEPINNTINPTIHAKVDPFTPASHLKDIMRYSLDKYWKL